MAPEREWKFGDLAVVHDITVMVLGRPAHNFTFTADDGQEHSYFASQHTVLIALPIGPSDYEGEVSTFGTWARYLKVWTPESKED